MGMVNSAKDESETHAMGGYTLVIQLEVVGLFAVGNESTQERIVRAEHRQVSQSSHRMICCKDRNHRHRE